jgi:hypothetical protein
MVDNTLVGGRGILKSERHDDPDISPPYGNKGDFVSVAFPDLDLVIARCTALTSFSSFSFIVLA